MNPCHYGCCCQDLVLICNIAQNSPWAKTGLFEQLDEFPLPNSFKGRVTNNGLNPGTRPRSIFFVTEIGMPSDMTAVHRGVQVPKETVSQGVVTLFWLDSSSLVREINTPWNEAPENHGFQPLISLDLMLLHSELRLSQILFLFLGKAWMCTKWKRKNENNNILVSWLLMFQTNNLSKAHRRPFWRKTPHSRDHWGIQSFISMQVGDRLLYFRGSYVFCWRNLRRCFLCEDTSWCSNSYTPTLA